MSYEAILREYVLLLAKAYAKARKVKLTTVSLLAYGDRPFLSALAEQAKKDRRRQTRSGRQASMTWRKMDDVINWLKTPSNWPDGNMPALPELHITIEEVRANGRCENEGRPATESTSTTTSPPS
jgi:hypothetical protein